MKKGLTVLSLFDGMSCGLLALDKSGIKVDKYFASEIKKHAIKCSKDNFGDRVIHIGDITKVSYNNGVLYTENGNYEVGKVDLLIGGSPCQDFSQANINISGLNGEKSKLFYEYLRLKKEINPKYFLLENVKMKKEWEDIITFHLNVSPTMIDSSLFVGALRKRNYWTNIDFEKNIIDRNVKLQDILVDGYTDREKARTLLESDSRPLKNPVKMFHRYQKFLTLVFKNKKHYDDCNNHYNIHFKGKSAKDIDLFENKDELKIYDGIRLLNKTERERLQGVPNGYCKNISENDSACLLGDGWTIDVISHIFNGIVGDL